MVDKKSAAEWYLKYYLKPKTPDVDTSGIEALECMSAKYADRLDLLARGKGNGGFDSYRGYLHEALLTAALQMLSKRSRKGNSDLKHTLGPMEWERENIDILVQTPKAGAFLGIQAKSKSTGVTCLTLGGTMPVAAFTISPPLLGVEELVRAQIAGEFPAPEIFMQDWLANARHIGMLRNLMGMKCAAVLRAHDFWPRFEMAQSYLQSFVVPQVAVQPAPSSAQNPLLG